MSKEKLKPCPFCGGEAILGMFNAWCSDCHAQTDRDDTDLTKEEVIWAWNRRANP